MSNKINMKTVDGLEEGLANKADIDLSNSPYTTNRILEIPQDIKLELNNGTLTLKAGSKVYVPNGFESDGVTPKFDVIDVSQDYTAGHGGGVGNQIVCINVSNNRPWFSAISNVCSGTTDTLGTTNYHFWYDTGNNIIKYYQTSGYAYNLSFPVCITTSNSSSQVTSIDQVFNGFGYIGSTVFALPGVKVQFPDGRNEDGTCINGYYTNDSVKTFSNISGTWCGEVWLGIEGLGISNSLKYIPEENRIKVTDGSYRNMCSLGYVFISSGKISSFTPCNVDSVANSNASNFSQAGRSYLSGLGMPANQAQQLTLLASGQSYTAPSNGWFSVIAAPNNGSYILLSRSDSTMRSFYQNTQVGAVAAGVFLPVLKGTSVSYTYSGSFYNGQNSILFIPAKGDV